MRLYADAGGDEGRLLEQLLPALLEIARTHRAAEAPDLACDRDGLLRGVKVVKVACVERGRDLGLEGSLDLLGEQ